MSLGLHGNGMHGFILDELETGKRVALMQAAEDADPLSWWCDLLYCTEFGD